MPRRRTPQEKKRLSYERDRRDDYGESNKGSRETVPRAKRRRARAERRTVRNALPDSSSPEEILAQEQAFDARIASIGPGWSKVAGTTLGEHVRRQLARRAALSKGDPAPPPEWYRISDIEALIARHGRLTDRDLERVRITKRPQDLDDAGYLMWQPDR